jgi:hypothetical protein
MSFRAKSSRGSGSPTRIRDTSVHTQWVSRPGFKILYVSLIALFWAGLHTFGIVSSAGYAWCILLHTHTAVTFLLLHWIKGAPEAGPLEDEELLRRTFWEQIDDGFIGTPARRFLCAMPIIIFFVTLLLNVEHDSMLLLAANALSTLVVLVPKHEALYDVRLFGINRD